MFSGIIKRMAKKKSIEEKQKHKHKCCIHCSEVRDEFLSNEGKPILGECLYRQHRFLLNEEVNCDYYANRINRC